MKPLFSIPKLCKSKKGWYVHFRYDKKQFRFSQNLNQIADEKEREQEYGYLSKAYHERLKEGWNPNTPEAETKTKKLTLAEAIDFAIEKKKPKIAQKTYFDYNCTIRFVKDAMGKLKLNDINITDVKRIHIKMIIEQVQKDKSLSNKAYNKHLGHFRYVLSELLQWDIIESNPANNIKALEVTESDANIPANAKDIQRIKTELESNHPNFYNFILTLFHTGIRPEEILSIKLSMIDLEQQRITLPPEITKTNRKRIVPINNHLLEYYRNMDFSELPKDYFLFGRKGKNNKHDKTIRLNFVPSNKNLSRDFATRYWEAVVKVKLKIPMNMYAMKHYGANQKILAGMSIEALKDLFGHSSKLMTRKYITELQEISRKEIIDKSPEL